MNTEEASHFAPLTEKDRCFRIQISDWSLSQAAQGVVSHVIDDRLDAVLRTDHPTTLSVVIVEDLVPDLKSEGKNNMRNGMVSQREVSCIR